MNEPVTINLDTLSVKSGASDAKSVSFGGGAEFLMNRGNKKKSSDKSGSINIQELDKLEQDLNALSDIEDTEFGGGNSNKINKIDADPYSKPISLKIDNMDSEPKPKQSDSMFGSMFGFGSGNKNTNEPMKVKKEEYDGGRIQFDEKIRIDNLNTAVKTEKTFDDYGKFAEVPIHPDKPVTSKPLSREEQLKRKYKILRKLDKMKDKGIPVSKNYTIDSNLDEMEGEYEALKDEEEKKSSIDFYGQMLVMIVNGLEKANQAFNPFDIDIDGLGENIQEGLESYEDIFEALHEKYKSKGTMAPELRLLLQLGGSAVMCNITNKMIRNAGIPQLGAVMQNNPALARNIQQATAEHMAQQSGGATANLGKFMQSVSEDRKPRPEMVQRTMTSPPPPAKTSIRNDAVSMDNQYASVSQPPPTTTRTQSTKQQKPRAEMREPSNIDDLLSRVRTKYSSSSSSLDKPVEMKTVNVEHSMPSSSKQRKSRVNRKEDGGSTISVKELMEMKKDADNLPRKSNHRKQKSEKNTVSLAI